MIQLDPARRKELKLLRKQCRDNKVYVKLSTILMVDAQYTPAQIEECLGANITTVYRYAKEFNLKDITDFLTINNMAYAGKLKEKQEKELAKEVEENLYLSSKEVAAYILRKFGIPYTEKGVVKLLYRLGFSYKKTKQVPAKAKSEEQQSFVENLNALWETAT